MIGIRPAPSFDSTKDRRRSDDIHRLLDPSYNTSYYRSSQRQNTYGAYVDAHGVMHDPDYRQFPLISQPTRGTRAHWDDDESALHSEDEDEDYSPYTSYNNRSSFSYSPSKSRGSQFQYSPTRRSNSPTFRGYSSSGAILSPALAIVPNASPISNFTNSSSSSSSSMLSRAHSPIDYSDECSKDKSRCRSLTALKRKRRRSSGATSEKDHEEERARFAQNNDYTFDSRWPSSVDDLSRRNRYVEDVEEEDEGEQEEDEKTREKPEWAPTCAESMKKQWQSLSLRVRFGMFRAERRIKQRVQSLI